MSLDLKFSYRYWYKLVKMHTQEKNEQKTYRQATQQVDLWILPGGPDVEVSNVNIFSLKETHTKTQNQYTTTIHGYNQRKKLPVQQITCLCAASPTIFRQAFPIWKKQQTEYGFSYYFLCSALAKVTRYTYSRFHGLFQTQAPKVFPSQADIVFLH